MFAKIERLQQSTASLINRGVNTLLEKGDAVKGLIAQKAIPKEEQMKKFEKMQEHLQDMTQNPTKLMDALEANTAMLHQIAPNINTNLNVAAARATQFLASKLPTQNASSMLTPAYKPSGSEMARFNRYVQTVENPLHVLEQMRKGNLTSETLETLQTVYPQLLKQMQNDITQKLDKKTMAKMPYQSKLMISAFLGSDLTNSLSQPSILSAQITSVPPAPGPGQQRPKTHVGPSQKGLGKLNLSQSIQTDRQRSSNRMR